MRALLHSLLRHPTSLIGAALATLSSVLFFTLLGVQLAGFSGGPYLGLLTFIALPALLLLGLALIPLGLWRDRKRRALAAATGQPLPDFPILDFNRPSLRNTALAVCGLTALNATIFSVGTYKSVQVMHSSEFCGTSCHTPMGPEYTAYLQSPHAQVECVECHVGSGATHFVKAKLSGVGQLFSVLAESYPRPIPTPVAHMRPATETCARCHSPARFTPDKLKVLTHFSGEEERNARRSTVLLLKVGGPQGGQWQGIHWHNDPRLSIRFLADPDRRSIHTVELTRPDGSVKRFQKKGAPAPSADGAWRTMDCTDCHNRPAHAFHPPEQELDAALARGSISPELPFIRREGLHLLQGPYASQQEARERIAQGLRDFYSRQHPEVASSQAARLDAAAQALGAIYSRNVFPDMKVDWNTYADFSAHDGCMRCHDNEHVTESGEEISKGCSTCHEALATDEEDPEVLQVLYP